MNKQQREKKYLNLPRYKKIYAVILDWVILAGLSLIILFGVVSPILNSQVFYQNLVSQKDENYTTIQEIGVESKLISISSDSGTNYTFDMMYKLYAAEHILLSYSYSPENLDDIGFTTDLIASSIAEASYSNDFLAYFYTDYITDKTASDNSPIIDTEDYKEYYKDNVLDIDSNDWWVADGDELPHLTDDYARYLTEYLILGISYSTITEVSDNFEIYFSELYTQAGSDLMKVPEYLNAYNNYTEAYDSISSIKNSWVAISTGFIFLLSYILYPLIHGNYQTLGYRIFHLGSADENQSFKYYHYILKVLGSLISAFFVIGLVGLLFSGSSFFGITLFTFSSITFTTGIFIGLSVLIDIGSLIGVLFTTSNKGLSNLLSGTQDYEIIY
jgi:hypothetical protein